MTNAEAWFNIALRPRKPEGSLGRKAQDGHLDFHTAPELIEFYLFIPLSDLDQGYFEVTTKWSGSKHINGDDVWGVMSSDVGPT